MTLELARQRGKVGERITVYAKTEKPKRIHIVPSRKSSQTCLNYIYGRKKEHAKYFRGAEEGTITSCWVY